MEEPGGGEGASEDGPDKEWGSWSGDDTRHHGLLSVCLKTTVMCLSKEGRCR